jgi:purine-nucleoside phosphorylase
MEAYIFINTIDIDFLIDNEQIERIDLEDVQILTDEHGNKVFVTTDYGGYLQTLFADSFYTVAFILNKLLNEYGVKVIDLETVGTFPSLFQNNNSFRDFLKLSAITNSDSEIHAEQLKNIDWGKYYNNKTEKQQNYDV